MLSWLRRLLGFGGHGVDELARRLGMLELTLESTQPRYREFVIPKRTGGRRRILAPEPELKNLQRRILARLLDRLRVHPAAVGFQRGESFVTNAQRHVGRKVVLRFDIQNFFPSITADRVARYFRAIGWNRRATALLVRLCTHDGRLPQGAPTSPRLSNLVNFRLDARLAGLARKCGAVYTRYADDLTFSLAEPPPPARAANTVPGAGRKNPRRDRTVADVVAMLLGAVPRIVRQEGYKPHRRRKVHVRRAHQRQLVTGLVVNEKVSLPREVRRWLRSVEHRARLHSDWRLRPSQIGDGASIALPPPTLSPQQLAGWQALRRMVHGDS